MSVTANFDWTDERVEQLKKWWAEGYTASQMATGLTNITRSAVLGKVRRLNLTKRKEPRKDQHRDKAVRRKVARWRRDGTSMKLFDTTTGDVPNLATDHCPNPLSLLELHDDQCHWPASGEGISAVFCGDEAVKGFPYCLHHCRIAYRAPERHTKAQKELIRREMARSVSASRIAAGEWK